jgi:hypothetical protein
MISMAMAMRQPRFLLKPLSLDLRGEETDGKVDTKRICRIPFRDSRGNDARRPGGRCSHESPGGTEG